MSRVKRGPKARHRRKKILKQAKGYRAGNSKQFIAAKEKTQRAGNYAFRDRRVKKRDFRALWITRIGIASKLNGLSYSKLVAGLKKAVVTLDRKVLADIAVRQPAVFKEIVALAQSKLAA